MPHLLFGVQETVHSGHLLITVYIVGNVVTYTRILFH